MDKVYPSVDAAIEDVFDGAVIAFGGFFSAGKPTALTLAPAKTGPHQRQLPVCERDAGQLLF
jgi:acyl CoA:acetate/3-ketoacid CoA transferase alpha subunit